MSVETHSPRWISLDGAVNARTVVPGVLLRADNLQSLSERDVRLLVEQHALEVVLDLRTDFEVRLEGPGPISTEPSVRIEHRSLYPDVGENADLLGATGRPWVAKPDPDDLPDETAVVRSYMNYLHRRPDSIVGSVQTIARSGGAVLVHCAAGKDRTGVVVALALDAAEVDRATIAGDYLATAERIDAVIERLLSSPTYSGDLDRNNVHRHAPVSGTIERVLELVDQRFGGSAAWLSAHGLRDADLEQLRRRLAPAAPDAAGPRARSRS